MRQQLVLGFFTRVLLAGCGRANPDVDATPAPGAKSSTAALTPSPALPATVPVSTTAPAATLPPTATSLADGLTIRLGTPDPSPNCPDPYPWFFANPAEECAAIILNTWTVLQPFEHGLMVWTQEGGRTYVLLDDRSPFRPYRLMVDPLGLPLPEADPSLVPPAGLYQPVLGFALFWRGLVPGHEWVRQRLGWAVAPEMAYSAFWQCSTATDAAARCYFNGPRDEIIALTSGGAQYWTYVPAAR